MTHSSLASEHRSHRTTLLETEDSLVILHDQLEIAFSRATGAPTRLVAHDTGLDLELAAVPGGFVEWDVGGEDIRRPPDRVAHYQGTQRYGAAVNLCDHTLARSPRGVMFTLRSECEDWQLVSRYTFAPGSARIAFESELIYTGADEARLRGVRVSLGLRGFAGDGWLLEIPGAPMPPAVALDGNGGTVAERLALGTKHIGLVGVHPAAGDGGIAIWAPSTDFVTYLSVRDDPDGVDLQYDVAAAARLGQGEAVQCANLFFDCFSGSWEDASHALTPWATVGVRTPDDRADWARNAAFYEVHIGSSPFLGGQEYAPFPTGAALLTALSKIRALGFDVIQIMPREPFPSYTTQTFRDVTTSWGEEAELRELIAAAHSHGMRVILDIVLHGVVDQGVLESTLTSIRDTEASPDWPSGLGGSHGDWIRLAQYVHEAEPSWRESAPGKHPVIAEHPDWFVKTDTGEIASIYTHALDPNHPGVQEFIIGELDYLVEELDVDGFRIDAPQWNEFPNWADDNPLPAGHVMLGAVGLLAHARARLKARRPDILIYTEPTGPLYRISADSNYNYDELWMIDAVLRSARLREVSHPHIPPSGPEMTAQQMAAWLAARDRALPAGSVSVRQIDSHDTFWWPEPGTKWCRERYGRPATRAMMAVFGLIGGSYLHYVGAEEGEEAFIRRMLYLRHSLPEVADGVCDYLAVPCDDPMVFTALRVLGDLRSVLAVNLKAEAAQATLRVPTDSLGMRGGFTVHDALGEEFLAPGPGRLVYSSQELERLTVPLKGYQPRLLMLRGAQPPSED